MAARRFGLISVWQSTQIPNIPASIVSIAGVLNSIQLVRTCLDRQGLAVSSTVSQFSLAALECSSECAQVHFCHKFTCLLFL
jgi:hypothetical protein